MSSQEFLALQEYSSPLEAIIKFHLEPIAKALAKPSTGILTKPQCTNILKIKKQEGASELMEIVNGCVEHAQDSSIFDKFLDVAHLKGNQALRDLVKSIKSFRQENYRELFPEPSNSPGDEYDVFISYGRELETEEFVVRLKTRLEGLRLKVFIDTTSISPGDRWPLNIANALHSCKAFVAVLTKKYVKSPYCRGELFQAVHLKKPLFPAVRENGWSKEPSGKSVYDEVHFIQYAFVEDRDANYEIHFRELIDSISNCRSVVPGVNPRPPVAVVPGVNPLPTVAVPVVNPQPTVAEPVANPQPPVAEPVVNPQPPVAEPVVNSQPPVAEPVVNRQPPVAVGVANPLRGPANIAPAGACRSPTLTDYQDDFNLTDEQMGRLIEERDLFYLGGLFGGWRSYAGVPGLGLTAGEQHTIHADRDLTNNQMRMKEALRIWQCHNPLTATFRNLLSIVLQLNDGKVAKDISGYISYI